MHTFPTSNTPILTPLARRQALSERSAYRTLTAPPPRRLRLLLHGGARQSLDRDHLAYCDLARERQQHAYELVREHFAFTVARVNERNSTLSDALFHRPKYVAGG